MLTDGVGTARCDRPLTQSEVMSPTSLEVNLCILNYWEHGSWDLPLHTWHRILTAWLRTCVESWVVKKSRPNLQHKSQDFLHMINNILWLLSFNECTPYFSAFVRLTSWDFASVLGVADMSETWDPMWTGPKFWCNIITRIHWSHHYHLLNLMCHKCRRGWVVPYLWDAVSCRWTGWDRQITGWNSRL